MSLIEGFPRSHWLVGMSVDDCLDCYLIVPSPLWVATFLGQPGLYKKPSRDKPMRAEQQAVFF